MKKITHRENEVLGLIASESTVYEIAKMLHISHHTLIPHRKNLIKKTWSPQYGRVSQKGFWNRFNSSKLITSFKKQIITISS